MVETRYGKAGQRLHHVGMEIPTVLGVYPLCGCRQGIEIECCRDIYVVLIKIVNVILCI